MRTALGCPPEPQQNGVRSVALQQVCSDAASSDPMRMPVRCCSRLPHSRRLFHPTASGNGRRAATVRLSREAELAKMAEFKAGLTAKLEATRRPGATGVYCGLGARL